MDLNLYAYIEISDCKVMVEETLAIAKSEFNRSSSSLPVLREIVMPHLTLSRNKMYKSPR